MPLLLLLFCRMQHIFDEDAVSGIWTVNQHMGHGADDLIVLNDGTSAHE